MEINNLIICIIAVLMGTIALYVLYSILLFKDTNGQNLQITKKNMLEQIEYLYQKKEYGILEMLAKRYLERVPKNYPVRYYLAKVYSNVGKIAKSIRECEIILKAVPNYEDARILLAQCYKKKNAPSRAIAEYVKILEKSPNNELALSNIAELYTTSGKLEKAIDAYNRLSVLVETNADIADLKLKIAELNEIHGDYPAAFEAYKARLEIYPNDYETSKKLINLYIKVENYEKAVSTMESTLVTAEQPSLQTWLIENATETYKEMGQSEEALNFATRLLNLPEYDNNRAMCNIAVLQIDLGRYEEGINILKDIVKKGAASSSILKILADAYRKCGRYDESYEIYKKMLDIATTQDIGKIHALLCELYIDWGKDKYDKNDLHDAFKLLTLAVQFNPSNPKVYSTLAEFNLSIKNYNEALSQIKKAIEFDSIASRPSYYLSLAECYHNLDNTYEEKKVLTELISIQPNNAVAHFRLGMICETQHDIASAKIEFVKASELDKKLTDAKYHLALIYETHGDSEQALRLYNEILEDEPDNKKVLENIRMLTG